MGKARATTARAREMATLLAACDRSGLSQSAFARQYGLTPGAFAWWRHELGRPRRPGNRRRGAAFVEVTPAERPGATSATGTPPFVVRLPSGAMVRIPATFDATALATVVDVLTRGC